MVLSSEFILFDLYFIEITLDAVDGGRAMRSQECSKEISGR